MISKLSELDFVLNLVDVPILFLASASTLCNEVRSCPKRGLSRSNNGFLLLFLYSEARSLEYNEEVELSLLLLEG